MDAEEQNPMQAMLLSLFLEKLKRLIKENPDEAIKEIDGAIKSLSHK